MDGERRLGIPASLLSAVVGTGVFASLSLDPGIGWKIATGALALISSALAALATFLKQSERADQYRKAALKYGSARRRIERELLFLPDDEVRQKEILESVAAQLDEAAAENVNAPTRYWRAAQRKVRGSTSNG